MDEAILLLRPTASFNVIDGVLEWCDDPALKPTDEEIKNKMIEVEAGVPYQLLREERNFLLQETDYLMIIDYPHKNKEEWILYRQALRDLPATITPTLDENGYLKAEFPTKPNN
tara:strand:- start:4025 stop:4366 length:342 start_codon:yes stop_codon:yes gene_type:complete